MKKILFLMLSLAVASSAIAGPVKHVQKSQMPLQTTKAAKFSTAPVVSYNLNVNAAQINAPKVQKQHNVYSCEGLRILAGLSNPTTLRNPVTQQPDGTVTYYKREGKANYQASGGGVAYGDQGGTVTVVENGNTVWFQNLLYDPNHSFSDYWIQGTKNGNTITISVPQDIDAVKYASYGITIMIGWGATYIDGNYIECEMSPAPSATFTIDGDVMTLNNAGTSANYTGNGLCAYFDYGGEVYYGGATLFNTTLTKMQGEIPEAPVVYTDDDIEALGGSYEDWTLYYRTGYAIYRVYDEETGSISLELGEQKGYAYVYYADNGDVYMRDPVYTLHGNGTWIKGTKNGNTLTFPLDQYVLYFEEDYIGIKTSWGQYVDGEGYTDMPEVTEVTYTIDNECLYLNDCGMSEDETTFVGLSLLRDSAYLNPGWYGALDFWTEYYAIPGACTNVTVDPAATTCNVAWTAGENNTKWNVRYREWVDPSTLDYFFEDFEGDELVGWSGWDMDGDDYWWEYRELDDGTYCMTSASYVNNVGALTPDNWLVSPEITLDGVVRFDAWGQDPAWAEEVFAVYFFVGDTATIEDPAASFIKIGADQTATDEATEYTFVIPEEYWGQQGYVAIRHYNCTNMFYLNIDNVYVGNADGGNAWTYVYDVEDPATVLTGLTPNTTYEVQVQGANAGGVGPWTEAVQFTTLDQTQPEILRGDVDGNGKVNMDDLTTLINFLLTRDYDLINVENSAICDSLDSDTIGMDDLTALINYLLVKEW